MRQTTDPTSAVNTFECDRAGDTTKEIVEVRAQGLQPQQTRTTTMAYDSLGRALTITGPSGEDTINSYDLAGRIKQTKAQITNGVFAQTDFAYDHSGHLRTETLPDPDGAGVGAPSPVVTHGWNWVDLEISTIDARGKTWSTNYDALSRVLSKTSPMGAVSSTAYHLGSNENTIIQDAPSGASAETATDILGRTERVQVEDYEPTLTVHDVLGNVTLSTDPAGIQTQQNFNDLSELTSTVEFFGSGSPATTSFTYDVAGRLQQVNGPLSSPDDRITTPTMTRTGSRAPPTKA